MPRKSKKAFVRSVKTALVKKPKVVSYTKFAAVQTELDSVQSQLARVQDQKDYLTTTHEQNLKYLREQNLQIAKQVEESNKRASTAENKVRETEAELRRSRQETKRAVRALHILSENVYEG